MSEHEGELSLTGIYLKQTELRGDVHSLGEKVEDLTERLKPFDQGNGSSIKTQVEVMKSELRSLNRIKQFVAAVMVAVIAAVCVDVWSVTTARHQRAEVSAPAIDVEALKRDIAQTVIEAVIGSVKTQNESAPKAKFESVPAMRRRSKPRASLSEPGQLRDALGFVPRENLPPRE